MPADWDYEGEFFGERAGSVYVLRECPPAAAGQGRGGEQGHVRESTGYRRKPEYERCL